MKRKRTKRMGARVALSFAVAASMMLGGLPVPALEALADEAEVIAEEAPVSNEQPVQSGATTEEALAVQDDGEDPFVPGGMTANQELIFIDGTATLSVHLDKIGAPEGTQPELKAGRFYPGGVGNNGLQWGDDLEIEGLLRYDEESSTVIVDGTKLADTDLVSNRNVGVYINADFTWGESESQTTKVGSVVLFVDVPFVGHDQENERVMLRGWDGDVDREYNVYVENAAFPNGEDLRYTVTNVEVATNEPDQAGEEVLAITQKDDGQGWHYEARNFGRAVVRVTYRDPAELGGGTGSYTFDVHVDDVVYDLNLRTSTGSDRLLPGKSVDFEVTGRRKWENPETGERGDDSDGLSYSWDVVSTRGDLGNVPENVASIDQNGRLTALALPDDVHGVWQFVNVRVTMKDAHDPNANTTCDFELKICDDYTEVWPPAINSRLIPGKSQTITPEVRNYRVDFANDYEVIPNVTFEASEVDQNAVTVEKNGDGSFTITRLDRYPTDFFITGRWADDEHDDLEKPCRYHLDHTDFGMSFKNGDQERLCPGDSVTLEPEAAEADRDLFDSCELDWSVGVVNDRGEFSYDNTTSDDEKVFSVVGNTIVLDANKCLANDTIREHGGANVRVRAMGGDAELADAWCWVELFMDYDAWFEWDEDSTATEEGDDEHGHWINPLLYNDWTTTLTLNTEAFAAVPNYHMQPELMLKGETGGEEQVVPLEQGYTIDGNTITLDGATVNQIAQSQQWDEVWGVDVCFRVMYGSGNDAVELCDAHQWVGMRTGCEDHVWPDPTIMPDPTIITEPTCEQPGSRKQTCEKCDEVRLVPIPAKGHTLDAVAAKPATLTATGTKAHHKCSVCHKLFSDAAGTNEVTDASLTIAKLVNIAGAKVTVASKAYTGKAQTSAPVVKLGGKTLRAGTDYTVTGNQGTNAGSYVVTITGKGAYGGTAKGTFVITKIASAMTVKATKKKVKIADVAKKSQKVSGALTVKKQSGKVTYALNKKTKKAKATKKFKISSKGVVTVPKGTAKGKYSLKINVKDAGDINHAAKTKTVTLVITVK